MLVIPAVDVMEGKCVRLVGGDPSKSKIYYDNPLNAAERWVEEGAELIHIVDLDAALGKGENTNIILEMVRKISVKVQLGGGLETYKKAEKMLKSGVFRVIFGTNLLFSPEVIRDTVKKFGSERVSVALDVKDGKIMFDGWRRSASFDLISLAKYAEDKLKVGSIIFTSVNRDGALKGPSIRYAKKILNNVKIPVVVSGGISSLSDIQKLREMGIYGAIVGTALYEGIFPLKDAVEVAKGCLPKE
ncbi:MAG: 1-(5-phosphoribosyl)-5-[(5-phosphoribosylamino)methylideneamino]imidazole-4-carboxamide isomerase [Candidatus Bathyarchaeia archaeon]